MGWGLIAATLLVTPLWALDPINPIKMLVVVPVGFMSLGLILANRTSVGWSKYKVVLGLLSAFVVWQVLVVLISGGEIDQQPAVACRLGGLFKLQQLGPQVPL